MTLRSPKWFCALLIERGQNPSSFARAIGVTPATVHRLIAGTRKASPSLAARVAQALDESVTVLFQVDA